MRHALLDPPYELLDALTRHISTNPASAPMGIEPRVHAMRLLANDRGVRACMPDEIGSVPPDWLEECLQGDEFIGCWLAEFEGKTLGLTQSRDETLMEVWDSWFARGNGARRTLRSKILRTLKEQTSASVSSDHATNQNGDSNSRYLAEHEAALLSFLAGANPTAVSKCLIESRNQQVALMQPSTSSSNHLTNPLSAQILAWTDTLFAHLNASRACLVESLTRSQIGSDCKLLGSGDDVDGGISSAVVEAVLAVHSLSPPPKFTSDLSPPFISQTLHNAIRAATATLLSAGSTDSVAVCDALAQLVIGTLEAGHQASTAEGIGRAMTVLVDRWNSCASANSPSLPRAHVSRLGMLLAIEFSSHVDALIRSGNDISEELASLEKYHAARDLLVAAHFVRETVADANWESLSALARSQLSLASKSVRAEALAFMVLHSAEKVAAVAESEVHLLQACMQIVARDVSWILATEPDVVLLVVSRIVELALDCVAAVEDEGVALSMSRLSGVLDLGHQGLKNLRELTAVVRGASVMHHSSTAAIRAAAACAALSTVHQMTGDMIDLWFAASPLSAASFPPTHYDEEDDEEQTDQDDVLLDNNESASEVVDPFIFPKHMSSTARAFLEVLLSDFSSESRRCELTAIVRRAHIHIGLPAPPESASKLSPLEFYLQERPIVSRSCDHAVVMILAADILSLFSQWLGALTLLAQNTLGARTVAMLVANEVSVSPSIMAGLFASRWAHLRDSFQSESDEKAAGDAANLHDAGIRLLHQVQYMESVGARSYNTLQIATSLSNLLRDSSAKAWATCPELAATAQCALPSVELLDSIHNCRSIDLLVCSVPASLVSITTYGLPQQMACVSSCVSEEDLSLWEVVSLPVDAIKQLYSLIKVSMIFSSVSLLEEIRNDIDNLASQIDAADSQISSLNKNRSLFRSDNLASLNTKLNEKISSFTKVAQEISHAIASLVRAQQVFFPLHPADIGPAPLKESAVLLTPPPPTCSTHSTFNLAHFPAACQVIAWGGSGGFSEVRREVHRHAVAAASNLSMQVGVEDIVESMQSLLELSVEEIYGWVNETRQEWVANAVSILLSCVLPQNAADPVAKATENARRFTDDSRVRTLGDSLAGDIVRSLAMSSWAIDFLGPNESKKLLVYLRDSFVRGAL